MIARPAEPPGENAVLTRSQDVMWKPSGNWQKGIDCGCNGSLTIKKSGPKKNYLYFSKIKVTFRLMML